MAGEAVKKQDTTSLTTALSIAGSDSGGGAGIQADLNTFFCLGIHGTSVITAITAQNTRGVAAWQAVAASLVLKQLEAVTSDFSPAAMKTGMIPSTELITDLGKQLKSLQIPLVVDPVLVASSGDSLVESGTVQAIREYLLPAARLVTPNYPEAEALTGSRVSNRADGLKVARQLLHTGCQAVLLKGGHGQDEIVEDLLVTRDGHRVYQHPRLAGVFHGTGCTLSAAITAYIARGESLEQAVTGGIALVGRAMESAIPAASGLMKILRLPASR